MAFPQTADAALGCVAGQTGHGTVPDLAPRGDTGRAFALFYTGVPGAGGLAPIAHGFIADHTSQTIGIMAAALRPSLRQN